MPAETITLSKPKEQSDEFNGGEILSIAGGHFIHDTYTAMVPTLLPRIIEKLALSLTEASLLPAISQLPSLINPFIGYMADKVSLRYFVILAPAVSATLISLLGLAPTYFIVLLLLFTTGISIAAFHAPAPAMIGQIAGRKVGRGMSYFMAGGELARTAGPLLAVWAVSTWTLEGSYRVVALGWAATLVLYWRLRNIPARPKTNGSLKAVLPSLGKVFLPVLGVIFFRNFLNVSLTTFLPTYMDQAGASYWLAGGALSVLEFAGVAGALSSGTLSDRLGRKPVLLAAISTAAVFGLVFNHTQGWLLVPTLLILGFSALSTTPVLMAIIQEQFPNNRAVANGLFLAMAFLLQMIATLTVGFTGDLWGLRTTYTLSALVSFAALPFIFALPGKSQAS